MFDSSNRAARTLHALTSGTVRIFHQYANWLVGISWWRFALLSLLLLILSGVLQRLPPFNTSWSELIGATPPLESAASENRHGRAAPPPWPPIRIDGPAGSAPADNDRVMISIDENGVRITSRGAKAATAGGKSASPDALAARGDGAAGSVASVALSASGSSSSSNASSASNAAGVAHAAGATGATGTSPASSASASSTNEGQHSIEISLPGATRETLRAAVRAAREAAREAKDEAREDAEATQQDADQAVAEARREAAAARRDAAEAKRESRRTRVVHMGDSLNDLAFFWIVASALLKISYKGRVQAEVKAAAATETAESEQLKRQVVEARMAAMQAQVEPHFLFNTLASIDHLIETDPPRASQMQKNLIALLRASMPAMRENHPSAHTLGREMAVIRPYLEILKVRMEDRLRTDIQVPEGLLSADFPPMMVQSLVENAIKHGLEPKPEGGKLTVAAEIVHGMLAVSVADTGLGFGKAPTAGTGVGLANIRERLQLHYGAKASMTIAENLPSGTMVTLTVPYQALAPGQV